MTTNTIIDEARRIATWAHEGQVDKAGRPYIEHPEAVAAMVVGTYAKATALLHDVVEDTRGKGDREITLAGLDRAGCPAEIVGAVDLLTRPADQATTDRTGEVYYSTIARDPLARVVKLADIAHNAGRVHALPDEALRVRLEAKYEHAFAMIAWHSGGDPYAADFGTHLTVSRATAEDALALEHITRAMFTREAELRGWRPAAATMLTEVARQAFYLVGDPGAVGGGPVPVRRDDFRVHRGQEPDGFVVALHGRVVRAVP